MKRILILALLLLTLACSAERLVLATMNWEPYYGKELKNNGYCAEITKEAFKKAGYEVEYEFVTWKRALELAKKGKYDGVLGIYYSKERENFFQFTDEYAYSTGALFKDKNRKLKLGNSYKTLHDLEGYKISSIRGGVVSEEYDKADYLNKEFVSTEMLSIKKLMKGRVELLAGSKENVAHVVTKHLPEYKGKIVALDPPLTINKIYNTITKTRGDAKQITEKFNKALAEMKSDGSYDKILKKHGMK